MTVNLAGPKNNSQYVLRSVLKGGSCMIAGDSDGNEPTPVLGSDCRNITAPYAWQFNNTPSSDPQTLTKSFIQFNSDGRLLVVDDNSKGSPVNAVVNPDNATLWNILRSGVAFAAYSFVVIDRTSGQKLYLTVGNDNGFGNFTLQPAATDGSQGFMIEKSSDIINFNGVNV